MVHDEGLDQVTETFWRQPLTQDAGTPWHPSLFCYQTGSREGQTHSLDLGTGNKDNSAGLGLVLKALCSVVWSIMHSRLLVGTDSDSAFVFNE